MNIGQGHGHAGRYAGLPDPYGSESSSKIVILPIPFDKTSTYQKGSDKGPDALIEASRNMELYDIETDSQVYLKGIYTAPPIEAETSETLLESIIQRTAELLAKNKFVVGIGGEHTISYGLIRAYSDYFKSLTILQLDAHADRQDTYEGNPWSHACVMARIKELPNISQILSVGIRSMSQEELSQLDRSKTWFAHEIDENDRWINEILKKLSDPIYITIDLDVFDSSLMPSTGTPEPGGLNWNQTLELLKRVILEKTLVGFDIVELCPKPCNPAPDFLAAKLLYKILSYKFYEHSRVHAKKL
jgi:agmatinase